MCTGLYDNRTSNWSCHFQLNDFRIRFCVRVLANKMFQDSLQTVRDTVSSEAAMMDLCVTSRPTDWTCLDLATSGWLLMEEQLDGGWGGRFPAVRPTVCRWLSMDPSGCRSDRSATQTLRESLDGSETTTAFPLTDQSVSLYTVSLHGKTFKKIFQQNMFVKWVLL